MTGALSGCSGASLRALAARAAERRRRVIESARNLFCENGFHGTGIAQIAEASGIKVGQIYRDFADKDAIVEAIVCQDLARLPGQNALVEAVTAADPAAIRAWIDGFVGGEIDRTAVCLLPEILAEAARNDRITGLLAVVDARIRGGLEAALLALAPDPAKAVARHAVAEMILTLMIGAPQRVLAVPDLDTAALARIFSALVAREIDRLVA